MKKTVWIPPLALTCGLAGVAAGLLRWRLLSTGADHKGLLEAGHPLGILSWILTAAVVAAAAALLRLLLGKKQLSPAFADIPALLFYLLCLLALYRGWSSEPEVQRYAFSLLALVCLMFATYFRSATALGMEKCPLFLGCGFLGVYFSFAAAADPGFTGMFLVMGVWMLWQLDTVAEEA